MAHFPGRNAIWSAIWSNAGGPPELSIALLEKWRRPGGEWAYKSRLALVHATPTRVVSFTRWSLYGRRPYTAD